jgi:hypothetical protein
MITRKWARRLVGVTGAALLPLAAVSPGAAARPGDEAVSGQDSTAIVNAAPATDLASPGTATITLRPSATGVSAHVRHALPAQGSIVCQLTGWTQYLGNNDNKAYGTLVCSALEDAISLRFIWYPHLQSNILRIGNKPPCSFKSSCGKADTLHVARATYLDVYICATAVKAGYVNSSGCVRRSV